MDLVHEKNRVKVLDTTEYGRLAIFLEEQSKGLVSRDFWQERFHLWWESNPSMEKGISRGWVLYHGDEIVGYLGNIPIKYSICGKENLACSACSWYVLPTFRNKSIEVLIPFLKQDRLLLNTTPIAAVIKILDNFNFKRYTPQWIQKDAIYPLSITQFSNYSLGKVQKKLSKGYIFYKPLFYGVVCLFKFYQNSLRNFTKLFNTKKYSCLEIQEFGNEYDTLYEQFKDRYRLTANRSALHLNWFFFGSKQLKETRKVLEVRDKERILGYVAFKKVKEELAGNSFFYFEMIDSMFIEENMPMYFLLLQRIRGLAEQDRDEIAFLKMNPFTKKFRKAINLSGFLWKKGNSNFLLRNSLSFSPEIPTEDTLFYATALDGDRCFFP